MYLQKYQEYEQTKFGTYQMVQDFLSQNRPRKNIKAQMDNKSDCTLQKNNQDNSPDPAEDA